MNGEKMVNAETKRSWARPEVKRLDAGSAESERGPRPDGGGGNQGS